VRVVERDSPLALLRTWDVLDGRRRVASVTVVRRSDATMIVGYQATPQATAADLRPAFRALLDYVMENGGDPDDYDPDDDATMLRTGKVRVRLDKRTVKAWRAMARQEGRERRLRKRRAGE
jgi:hypothetical protein